jgi:hypothetical protein
MNMRTANRKRLLLIIFIFFLLVGGTIAFFNNQTRIDYRQVPSLEPTRQIPDVPQEATLDGEVVCLPHKDTSGPQTLECAFGLKTDDGTHYALDAGDVNPPPYTTGQRIRANGLVTPIEAISSDHWQKYDIKGIFSIKGIL